MSERFARLFCEKAKLAETDATPELEAKLVALTSAARAAWPKIAVSEEAFVEHLATRAGAAPAPAAFLDGVHTGDLYLACGVCRHDRAALAAFEEHFMSRVPDYVLRVRVARDVVDEVQQRLRERLVMGGVDGERTPKIAEYSGKGALGGWLRVAAVRTALNHVRASGATKTQELGEEMSLTGDPELAYVKERASDLFNDAFERVLADLDANERAMLRLHYIDGLTMDQLAHLYKTPRSTIARRIAGVREQILSATEALLREERRLSPSSIASVIRQAQSQLEVTITRLLRQ